MVCLGMQCTCVQCAYVVRPRAERALNRAVNVHTVWCIWGWACIKLCIKPCIQYSAAVAVLA